MAGVSVHFISHSFQTDDPRLVSFIRHVRVIIVVIEVVDRSAFNRSHASVFVSINNSGITIRVKEGCFAFSNSDVGDLEMVSVVVVIRSFEFSPVALLPVINGFVACVLIGVSRNVMKLRVSLVVGLT